MSRPADPNAKIDLLRAAESVFIERGVDHAKIVDITDRAGHSKGSFYLHFESKEDAFRQIIESMLARLAACLDNSSALAMGEIRDLGEYLERWRVNDLEMFEFIWTNRRVMRLMLEGGGSAQFNYLIDQFAERSRAQCVSVLSLGIEQGLYRSDLDVEIASLMLAGGYDRVAREIVRLEKKPDLAGMLAAVQRVCLVGLATPELAAFIDRQVNNRGSNGNKRPHRGIKTARPVARKSNVRRSPVS